MSKTNFEAMYETLESTGKKQLMMRFYLWESAFGVSSDNCLSLAFRKYKKDCNILKVILVKVESRKM